MNKKNSHNSFVGFVFFAAVLGGVSAAVLSHPRRKAITHHLSEVGDDIVDAMDRALDKITLAGEKSEEKVVNVSDFFINVFDELAQMNRAVDKERTPSVEERVEHVAEDISNHIAWFEKKGRLLARKSTKGY